MRLAYENARRAQTAVDFKPRYPAARNNAKSPAAFGYMRPIAAGLVFAGGLVAAGWNWRLGVR